MKKIFNEDVRSGAFVTAWIIAGLMFVFNIEIQKALFIMANLILWAVLEQSFLLRNAIKELIQILRLAFQKPI